MLVIKGAMPEQQAVEFQFPGQKFLRQRWPLIRQLRLIAYQDEAAIVSPAPQGVGGLRAGLAAAHNDDRGDHWVPRGARVTSAHQPLFSYLKDTLMRDR